jgi:hypothetical protein
MRILPVLAALIILAGCGGSDESASSDSTADSSAPASQGAPIPGGGLSIQEAIASNLDGPLMIKGYIIERDGAARLCSAILESSPPQCGEPSLRIDGPAPAPSEEQASLLGEVDGETIVVSETAKG